VFDIRWIRENPDAFDAGLRKRGIAPAGEVKFAAELIGLDEARRGVITRLQEVQARRNAASKEIGKAKAAKDEVTANKLMAEVAALKDELAKGEDEQKAHDKTLHDALSVIPNLPADDVPEGVDEKGNKEVRKVGELPKLAGLNKPLQHFEIGERLDLMDFETAAKLSGARFVVLKGQMARLERALAAFMLDIHTAPEKGGVGGYTEIAPPMLVRDEVMYGTAQLPKFAEDQFFALSSIVPAELRSQFAQMKDLQKEMETVREERQGLLADFTNLYTKSVEPKLDARLGETFREFLNISAERFDADSAALMKARSENVAYEEAFSSRKWLIPTAEVPLTNLVRESIRDETELPIRVTAYTPCFRAEAGAAGKDTRGMIRQHQFSKVELVSITTPEQSAAEHERMTACAEEVLKRLGLAYRTVLLCTGDMGFAARKTYDIEVWLPGQNTYREISSCSVCGDFQARRMNARYRPKGSKETRFLHTLNGSGLAVGRTLIAILENYQQADGSVAIPDALVPYMGGVTKIGRAQ
jgi:seryl-tRNA synthetase